MRGVLAERPPPGDISEIARYSTMTLRVMTVGTLALALPVLWAQAPAAKVSVEAKEQFLLKAKVIKTRGTSQGITGVLRATLSDGTLTHEASIQCIDEAKPQFQTPMGTELNFRDTYKFNIAAYKLDKMLGLQMVPVTVERSFQGKSGSYCWWVDNVLMIELERMKKKTAPPDADSWNKQMHIVRVFDQLIYNTDRNLGNLVIDKDWRIWMIDHTRAFRMQTDLREPKNLVQCERNLLTRLKELTDESLTREIGAYVNKMEIKGLLARRDKIVAVFEKKGPSAIYDFPARAE